MKVKKRANKSSQSPYAIAVEPSAGTHVGFVCPECHGPLWEIRDGKIMRYQCLVGHRYSLASLLAAHAEELETALWIALRVLEERITMQRRLAEQSQANGRKGGGQMFQARVEENLKHARVLRHILEKLDQSGET